MSKQGSVGSGIIMAKRKLKKYSKDTSSGAGMKESRLNVPDQFNMYPLAAVALVVAVFVAPLTAEIPTCEYPGLLTSKSK